MLMIQMSRVMFVRRRNNRVRTCGTKRNVLFQSIYNDTRRALRKKISA